MFKIAAKGNIRRKTRKTEHLAAICLLCFGTKHVGVAANWPLSHVRHSAEVAAGFSCVRCDGWKDGWKERQTDGTEKSSRRSGERAAAAAGCERRRRREEGGRIIEVRGVKSAVCMV